MKKVIRFITIMIMIFVTAGAVQASSFSLAATPDKTELKAGESITITLKVSDIDLGETGMNALEGVLKYDNTIFEAITEDSVAGQNNWSASIDTETDNPLYGKFLFTKLSSGIKTDTVIGTITLRVKQTYTEAVSTDITISDIASNDREELIKVTDKVISIRVNPTTTPDPEPDPEPNTNEVPEMNITTNETAPGTNTNQTTGGSSGQGDNTTKKGTLPQTGEGIVLGTTIIAVGTLAIYFYIRAYKMK